MENSLTIQNNNNSSDISKLMPQNFDQLCLYANKLSKSKILPEDFRGDEAACMALIQYSATINMPALNLVQVTYPIKGRIAFDAKFFIALVNISGKIQDSVDFRYGGSGKDRWCEAFCTKTNGKELVEKSVLQESKGASQQWDKIPDQMLAYHAGRKLARKHFPEVVLGICTTDEEFEDYIDITPQTTVTDVRTLKELNNKYKPQEQPQQEPIQEPVSNPEPEPQPPADICDPDPFGEIPPVLNTQAEIDTFLKLITSSEEIRAYRKAKFLEQDIDDFKDINKYREAIVRFLTDNEISTKEVATQEQIMNFIQGFAVWYANKVQ